MEPIRLFIVDDHHVVRMGLQTMLKRERDIAVVGTAASASEALRLLKDLEVDVLLTDLRMPEMTGDAMLMELKKLKPNLKAAVLTNYHSDEEVFTAMKAGAMGYILKSATMEQILEAIRTIHAGERWIPAHVGKQLAERASRLHLSARETEILRLVAKGMRNREIGEVLCISENTVRNHMLNLLEKLGTTNRTEAIGIAVQQGLIRIGED